MPTALDLELPPFLAVLDREQRRASLSDGRYARGVLLISGGYFSMVKSGQRALGAKLIVGAFQAYPHNHGDNEHPPPPQPIDGYSGDLGSGCVACDLAEAMSSGLTRIGGEPTHLDTERELSAAIA